VTACRAVAAAPRRPSHTSPETAIRTALRISANADMENAANVEPHLLGPGRGRHAASCRLTVARRANGCAGSFRI